MPQRHTLTVRAPRARVLVPRLVPAARLGVAVLLLAGVAACDRGEVETQQVPAGSSTIPDSQQAPATGAPDAAPTPAPRPGADGVAAPGTTADAGFPWTTPDGWVFDPEPRPMRLATYQVPAGDGTAELAVTRFPGDVGGELANVNRWRQQMGLAPVTEEELPALLDRFESGAVTGYALRVRGDITHMLAAGIQDPSAGVTWFLRVVAAPETVDLVEDDVVAFARTIAQALAGDDG